LYFIWFLSQFFTKSVAVKNVGLYNKNDFKVVIDMHEVLLWNVLEWFAKEIASIPREPPECGQLSEAYVGTLPQITLMIGNVIYDCVVAAILLISSNPYRQGGPEAPKP